MRECLNCGSRFHPRSHNQRYCTDPCRKSAGSDTARRRRQARTQPQRSSPILDISEETTVARCLDCPHREIAATPQAAIRQLTAHVNRTHDSTQRNTYQALFKHRKRWADA